MTEWDDLKECDWCGGRYDKSFDSRGEKKIPPQFICSYECKMAKEYFTVLFMGFTLSIGSIALFAVSLVYPPLSIAFSGGGGVFIILVFGQAIGWPLMWCAKDSRRFRKEIPRDTRKGRRVGEPLG